MSEIFTLYRPLLDLIGRSEGTDRREGYNETLGYGRYTGGDRFLCGMTLDEIDRLQTAMLGHPDNKWQSSALGRYQIVRTTLRKLRQDQGLNPTDLFDAFMQDRLAVQLLIGRGFDRFISGSRTEDEFINALAREWASLPTTEGVGHYGGQSAHVTVDDVRAALAECRRRFGAGENAANAPPVEPVATTGDVATAGVVGTVGVAGLVVAGAIAPVSAPVSIADPVQGFGLSFAGIAAGLVLIAIAVLIVRRRRT
ncbi:hypothetical protein AWH62_00875 [Maricaulis sp. W15]|uniref:hypothetical protein n=1 Tax=Maricaulis sp. W15 TaxID=1772333 RepID=UPI000948AB1F|nr:hypothetical protein [Maricaulis sp. W15]OLF81260.1 hypothetical protein AWH62_00875 [Maricaulis sp. W15]